ncbi:uncharacterized protein [Magallana gigas]|uniref:uncharacterized protein n=1 Tax=Magallana gigas TaxID=29159 RepID=UPI003342A387
MEIQEIVMTPVYEKKFVLANDPCIESNLLALSDPGTRSMHREYKQGDGHCTGWYKADSLMLTQCPGLLNCGAIYPVWMNDPCIENNLRTLSDPGTRSMHCEYKQGDGHCDISLTPGWYKADSPMLTQCPGLLSCGAIYPVWMNGTNPGQGDGVVTRQVCQRGFTGCCTTSYDIKVKNCGSYTAYCLRQPSTCPARYCFGNGRCANNDKGKDSDKDDNKAHSHSTLEIILGVILAALILILITLVYSCLKRYKKGHGKTGSVVNIQKSEADRETTMANPMYRSEFDNPPPYSE